MCRALVLLLSLSILLAPLAVRISGDHDVMRSMHAAAQVEHAACDEPAAPAAEIELGKACSSCPCANALPALPIPQMAQDHDAVTTPMVAARDMNRLGLDIPPPPEPPRHHLA